MSLAEARGRDSAGTARAGDGRAEESFAVRRLRLIDFRNYAEATIAPGARLIALSGDNGAGKTNLLEALSLLASGRGLRGVPFAELARIGGSGGWSVHAAVEGRTCASEIGTGLESDAADGAGRARRVRIDGKTARGPGALDEHIRLIWLTPALDRLFAGPGGERRRFFDMLVAALDPAHRRRLAGYEKAMRERNRLLATPSPEPAWLDGLELQLAELGTALAAARNQAADLLNAAMAEMRGQLAALGFPHAALALAGEPEALLTRHKAVEVEDICRRMLRDSRNADARTGRMRHGPHRSDLRVAHGVRGMPAHLCSTGEKKALLIALVLAHARAVARALDGAAPVMLLDEIAAHLDARRRDGLMEYLAEGRAQVWMTGTAASLFAAAGARAESYRIDNGTITGC